MLTWLSGRGAAGRSNERSAARTQFPALSPKSAPTACAVSSPARGVCGDGASGATAEYRVLGPRVERALVKVERGRKRFFPERHHQRVVLQLMPDFGRRHGEGDLGAGRGPRELPVASQLSIEASVRLEPGSSVARRALALEVEQGHPVHRAEGPSDVGGEVVLGDQVAVIACGVLARLCTPEMLMGRPPRVRRTLARNRSAWVAPSRRARNST